MAKRIHGGSSPRKADKYSSRRDGVYTREHKISKMKRRIKGFRNPEKYIVKDMNIRIRKRFLEEGVKNDQSNVETKPESH